MNVIVLGLLSLALAGAPVQKAGLYFDWPEGGFKVVERAKFIVR